jgi:hypothetical protein
MRREPSKGDCDRDLSAEQNTDRLENTDFGDRFDQSSRKLEGTATVRREKLVNARDRLVVSSSSVEVFRGLLLFAFIFRATEICHVAPARLITIEPHDC